jgi:heme-degrading monooxygenase HmoA
MKETPAASRADAEHVKRTMTVPRRSAMTTAISDDRTVSAPKKSLFAVVFEAKPNPAQSSAYADIAAELTPELMKIDGFLENPRYGSRSNKGLVLSLSLWDSEKALVRWRSRRIHREDQAKARAGVLSDYHLRVGEVTAVAGKFADREVGWARHDETEVGAAKALVIVDGVMPDGAAATMTERVKAGQAGAVTLELFDHLTEANRLALLSAWQSHADASAFVRSIGPIIETTKLNAYVIRVIRDYGLNDRREAPQYHD